MVSKYLYFIIGAIVVGLLALFFTPLVFHGDPPLTIIKITPHFYKDPSINIDHISLKIFYAVPKNRTDKIDQNWKSEVTSVLDDAIKFHNIQLIGSSKLEYDIYPQPFILLHDNDFYDTSSTNRGNPRALESTSDEIEAREPGFIASKAHEFITVYIVYEGVGSSGAKGASLISRAFLSDPQYSLMRSTLFYHEFGHSIGFPDDYDVDNNQPYSDGIMGGGRRGPIASAYVEGSLLKDTGVLGK